MTVRRFSRAAVLVVVVAGVSLFGLASAGAAAVSVSVPCLSGDPTALVAAINAANGGGGGTVNLAAGCHYLLTAADNGENGLPVVTSRISVNGNGATIDGTGVVRVLEVDGPSGSLTLNAVTITGGSADIGGGIANLNGAVMLNRSQVTGNTATQAGGGI